MPSDMVGNWSTPVSAPNGPIQITWNMNADSRHLWSLGRYCTTPEIIFRKVWRKRKAELDSDLFEIATAPPEGGGRDDVRVT